MSTSKVILTGKHIREAFDKLAEAVSVSLSNLDFKSLKSKNVERKEIIKKLQAIGIDKPIESLTIDELHHLIHDEILSQDYQVSYYIQTIYKRKQNLEWIYKFILFLHRLLKHLIRLLTRFVINKRQLIRKYQSFIFKNLDDYHSAYLTDIPLYNQMLKLNMKSNEQYIKETRRGYSLTNNKC